MKIGTRRSLLYPIISNPWQHNGTWALGDSGWVNTPTLGSELLTDGELENWNSATDLTNWAETVAGTSTINQETSVIHGGTSAIRFDVDASSNSAFVTQGSVTIGTWISLSAWLKASGGSPFVSIGAALSANQIQLGPLTTSYVQKFGTVRIASTNAFIISRGNNSSSLSLYSDDVSIKAATLNTLFVVRTGQVASARTTLITATQAGIIAKLNSLTSPTDCIIGYHDGTNAVMLKLVSGTYTQLISTAATYVAGALIELKNPTGDIWQLFYNGTQRGTNQTIADASIVSGILAGGFSTHLGNTLTDLRTS